MCLFVSLSTMMTLRTSYYVRCTMYLVQGTMYIVALHSRQHRISLYVVLLKCTSIYTYTYMYVPCMYLYIVRVELGLLFICASYYIYDYIYRYTRQRPAQHAGRTGRGSAWLKRTAAGPRFFAPTLSLPAPPSTQGDAPTRAQTHAEEDTK